MLSYFELPYSNTCHSVQGLSIDSPMTVFYVNSAYVDRYYLWTSINVTIFQHPNEVVSASERGKIKQYFAFKVNGYKQQDTSDGRTFEAKDYITADWISDEFEIIESKCCRICRTPYETIARNGEVRSNLTVDRIDNTLPHNKDNCQLLCDHCNKTKSNHY